MKSGLKQNLAALLISLFCVCVLVILAIGMPFHLDETLQIAAIEGQDLQQLLHVVAATPAAAPLGYLSQAAVVHALGESRLDVRMLSIVFAFGSMMCFWGMCVAAQVPRPLIALAVFGLFPSHLMVAALGRPHEQALFFLLLSLLLFFRIRLNPSFMLAVAYTVALTCCIYTQPFAFLPAAGCLLFYLGAMNNRNERRAFWHLLPGTAIAGLSFLPYAIWSVPQTSDAWLTVPPPPGSVYEQAFRSLTGEGPLAVVLSALLIATALWGAWRGLRTAGQIVPFCMFGALLTTFAAVVPLDAVERLPVWPAHLVFLAPVLIVLFCFAIDSIGGVAVPAGAGIVLAVLFVAADATTIAVRPTFDPEAEAHAVAASLHGDSCVVFVSEGMSRSLFLPFEPGLEKRECHQFFHHDIVLAIHPYVRPEQMNNATTFFRGLNFTESAHRSAGGGQILVFTQPDQR